MKKLTIRKQGKIFALLLTAIMSVTLLAMPALAADTLNVNGAADAVTFNKYLLMDTNANVPNATFNFTIEPGTAVPADAANNKPAVMAGPAEATITSSVTFAPGDQTYTTKQGTDIITVPAGQKYAKKALTVNLSGVTFTAPGVYRYKITESGTAQGVTNDANTSRYLDVYVVSNDSGKLSIAEGGYVLHPTTDVMGSDGGAYANKDDGFIQNYGTKDLTLNKQITGNQGYRSQYFKFTVTIGNTTAGTVYKVGYSGGATSGDLTVNGTTVNNPTSITVPADATSVTQNFYLNDDDTITIYGLTADNTYNISEVNEDYTASYTIDAGTVNDGNAFAAAQTMGTAGHAVVFTNDRSGTVPTGILLDIAPYAIVLLFSGAAVILLLARKRKTSVR